MRGADSNKKAEVVNQMAETIARINKAEDFTRQQDYIRQCRGDPADRRGRSARAGQQVYPGTGGKAGEPDRGAGGERPLERRQAKAIPPRCAAADDESISLLFRHEQNERGMIRSLLEYGLKSWDDQNSVADYILERMRGTL